MLKNLPVLKHQTHLRNAGSPCVKVYDCIYENIAASEPGSL